VALALAGVGGLAKAADPLPEVRRGELDRLRAEAQRLENKLLELQQRQHDLAAQRERLETELALAEVRLREGEEARAVSAAAVEEARVALAEAQRRLGEAVERLRLQLGLLAVLGRSGLAPLLLQAAGTGDDLERRITVTMALVEEQKRRRDEVARLAEERTAALAQLSLRQAQLEEAAAVERARRGVLATTRGRVLAELARLEGERRRSAVALADLREAEARLERLWGQLARENPGRDVDVRLLRGGLPWPVDGGRIVGRFGRRRDAQYGTVTVSNGVSLEVAPGSEVRTVSEGVVAYAQYLKGYGNLVIVHHGAEVYSLYARLATMLVGEGRRVRIAEPVGLAGPPSEGEGNLYFEIRTGRRSQDPLAWLEPREDLRR
jgi:septal ring factor EnvC (AmiA/AmiB activator)